MKKIYLSLTFLLSVTALANASEFTYPRPIGTYSYAGRFDVPKIIRTKVIQESEKDYQKQITNFRNQGFSCTRRNIQSWICRKTEKPQTWPEGLATAIQKQMSAFTIVFSGTGTPVPRLDTSTTQEWMINEELLINGYKVQQYAYNFYYETKSSKVLFPVSEDQPIAYAEVIDAKNIGLNFLVNSTDSGMNIGYSIIIYLTTP